MPIIMPDTSEMEDLAPSQPGTYAADITKADSQLSKAKEGGGGNKPMVVPLFKFKAPRLSDKEVRGVSRRSFLSITGPGSFGFDQLLRCVGESALADKIKADPGRVPFDTDLLVGKRVNILVSTGVYKQPGQADRLTDQIDGFLPV